MTEYGFDKRFKQPNDHHWMLAFLAILLSAGLHLFFMYFFADWSLSAATAATSARIKERIREALGIADRPPPMQVETMRADPMRFAQKIKGEMDTPSRGPIEVSDHVETLRQSTPPALTAPPPIPREALTPGVPALTEALSEKVDTTPWVPRQEIEQIYDKTIQDEVATLPRREIPLIERVTKAPDVVPSIDLAGRQFGKDPEPPSPAESAEIFDSQLAVGVMKVPLPEVKAEKPNDSSATATLDTPNKFAVKPNEKSGKVSTQDKNTRTQPDKNGSLAANGKGGENGDTADTPNVKGPANQTGTAKGGGNAETNSDGQKPDGKANNRNPDATRATGSSQETVSSSPDALPQISPAEAKAKQAQEEIERLQESVDFLPIDNLLSAGLETFTDSREPDKTYFKISLHPRSDKPIPVIPKDIVFVQDVSGSMTKEGMVHCRRAITAALRTLNTGDRFDVVAFRDSFAYCFPTWVAATPDNIRKAEEFIKTMDAHGRTDVFGSLSALINLPRDPRRPMVAFVVTDGEPTAGLIESASIIGDFSKLNNGMMSIYMFGTRSKANAYLLDMLTYCNRGNSSILKSNSPWNIPSAMASAYESIRNPIMGDMTVVFDSASQSEVYPKHTPNLYKDRTLELYGVCPKTTQDVVFQIRGLAADKGYDSVFRLNFSKQAKAGTKDVRTLWARQRMYHLVGEYSRYGDPKTLAEMQELNKKFNIPIPYRNELKK
ncbi:MAG: VWA domain-containing protein [Kiritimatiellae bacterium]|nr:VWA domain-containing protein [Kiritimatiellia bacterium]